MTRRLWRRALIWAMLLPATVAAQRLQRYDKYEEPTMADAIWTSTDGNGNTGTSWSTGAVPGTGDTATFNGTSDVPWTTGLTLAGHPTLLVTRQNRAQLGLPGNGVKLTGSNIASVMKLSGDADIYIEAASIIDTIVEMGLGRCVFGVGADTELTRLFIKAGVITLGPRCGSSGGVNTFLHIDGDRANVTIEEISGGSLSAHLNYTLRAGLVSSDRAIGNGTNLALAGGEFLLTGLLGTVALVDIAGGRLIYAPIADPSGVVPNFLIDGTLDLRQSRFAIAAGVVVQGRRGQVLGSALQTGFSAVDIDLTEPLP